jgi:hypothetical protein
VAVSSVAQAETKITGKAVLTIKAFPNPSSTSFTLLLPGSANDKAIITVTDLLGRSVYQATGTGNQEYKFGYDFRPGIYLVKVIRGTDIQSIKLIKE